MRKTLFLIFVLVFLILIAAASVFMLFKKKTAAVRVPRPGAAAAPKPAAPDGIGEKNSLSVDVLLTDVNNSLSLGINHRLSFLP